MIHLQRGKGYVILSLFNHLHFHVTRGVFVIGWEAPDAEFYYPALRLDY